MSDRTGELNEKWAKLLIKELIHHGVRYFCMAPGSQSTALTLAAHEHPLANTFIHFDERGVCFHALGYAKATGIPAAIIVTSGTALGNLLPGIMEAHHAHTPLLILTADRPPELRDTGANQTSDHVKIFQNFVRWSHDLPPPSSHIPPSFIGSTVSTALSHALGNPPGPVHLNCMFRKPFFEIHPEEVGSSYERTIKGSQTEITFGEKQLTDQQIERLADELSEYEKGVIIVGNLPRNESLEPLFSLARLLQWPLFPDILSPLRSHPPVAGMISHYDLILKSVSLNEDLSPDAVLQFGDRFVSSKLLEWIGMKKPKSYVFVAPHSWRMDPVHRMTHRILADPWHTINKLNEQLPGHPPGSWLPYWQEINRTTEKALSHYFQTDQTLSQPALFHHLSSWLPSAFNLFIGNSLSIREADQFYVPKKQKGSIFGNRGLSGIDGNIATATGLSKGLKQPLIAILGDLSCLHDLTSLSQLKQTPYPMKLIVINNNGGAIFSFLPISQKKEALKPFFITPHGLSFKHAAALFGLSYKEPETLDEVKELLTTETSEPTLIEIVTNREETLLLHKEIPSHLKEVLATSSLYS
jgi:2-succinyl-5-enolpyruvyl-6-hydroxy-3-cyclohexene-1-carboxylate synthase